MRKNPVISFTRSIHHFESISFSNQSNPIHIRARVCASDQSKRDVIGMAGLLYKNFSFASTTTQKKNNNNKIAELNRWNRTWNDWRYYYILSCSRADHIEVIWSFWLYHSERGISNEGRARLKLKLRIMCVCVCVQFCCFGVRATYELTAKDNIVLQYSFVCRIRVFHENPLSIGERHIFFRRFILLLFQAVFSKHTGQYIPHI